MRPEDLAEKLVKASKYGLKSIILYGSAAAGDHLGKRSDYNILVVAEELGLDELKALAKAASGWMRAGNPPPLLFTQERLQQSADVFPIELLDIRDSHRTLYGEDVVSNLAMHPGNLRLQVEHELKGKLIQLRERFLVTEGKAGPLVELMIESWSTFLVLFRAALRLFQDKVPPIKMAALEELANHIRFDKEVFVAIEGLKAARVRRRDIQPERLFEQYLTTIENIIDAVDAHQLKES